jgi:hypothetical protein
MPDENSFSFSIFSYPDATFAWAAMGRNVFQCHNLSESFLFSLSLSDKKKKICLRVNSYASLFFRSELDIKKKF